MLVECECGETFQSRAASCPQKRSGCCVSHYDHDSFICLKCGHDMKAMVNKAMIEGPRFELPGIVVINLAAVRKLEFK